MARATSIAATPTPSPSPVEGTRRPVKITVKLTRNPQRGEYQIKSSHPIPDAAVVKAYMSKRSLLKITPFWYNGIDVMSLVNNTIGLVKPKEWADAIAKATAQCLNQQSRVETELLAVEGGGFLAIGNALFQLNVVDYIDSGSKALRAVRSQALEDAKVEGEAIVVAAQARASEIAAKADTYYNEQMVKGKEIMLKHEFIRQQGLTMPPDWCRTYGIPIMVKQTAVYVGFTAKIKIKSFEYMYDGNVSSIAAADAPAYPVLIWAPVDPFNCNRMFIDMEFGYLPHMTSGGCVTIGDAPKAITGLDILSKLRQSVERAFSIVNMSSLLSTSTQWSSQIKAFIPPKLAPIFNDIIERGDVISALAKHRIKPDAVDAHEAVAHVFTVKTDSNE